MCLYFWQHILNCLRYLDAILNKTKLNFVMFIYSTCTMTSAKDTNIIVLTKTQYTSIYNMRNLNCYKTNILYISHYHFKLLFCWIFSFINLIWLQSLGLSRAGLELPRMSVGFSATMHSRTTTRKKEVPFYVRSPITTTKLQLHVRSHALENCWSYKY